jgi:hypothetical protein
MNRQFGAGPFILSENILLESAEHRGVATDFVHTSAYGQWGKVMVELVRQEDNSPNTPFRDMYTKDQEGLHHTAIFVDHFDAAVRQFADSGLALATRCKTKIGGVEFGFIDATATLGHMIGCTPNKSKLWAATTPTTTRNRLALGTPRCQ